MTRTLRRLLGAAMLLAVGFPAAAQQETSFSPEQADAIRAIVRDYLVTHPEVLLEALQAFEARKREAEETRRREAVLAHREALEQDASSPVLGNPEGDVVVVEFFDYRCPYCRAVAPKVMEALRSDGGIRLVMKEFPILGPDSVYAARAALAAAKQGQYEAFHLALMEIDGEVNQETVLSVARELGLDVGLLQKDIASEEVDGALRRNFELAEALGVGGTPAFVIGNTLVPGALELKDLRALVAKARANPS